MSDTTTKQLGEDTVEMMGTQFEFLECTPERHPLGLEVHFYRPGELTPVRKGHMTPGSAILYLKPDVAQQFKGAVKRVR